MSLYEQWSLIFLHYPGVFYAIVGGLGLMVGSFLNVVGYRLMTMDNRREKQGTLFIRYDLARPGSHCPACTAPIKAYDNIPVLSYLLLKGRCRKCSSPISPVYPAIEFLTGALSLLCAYWLGPTLLLCYTLLYLWFGLGLLCHLSFYRQLQKKEADLRLVLPMFFLGTLILVSSDSVTADQILSALPLFYAAIVGVWVMRYALRSAGADPFFLRGVAPLLLASFFLIGMSLPTLLVLLMAFGASCVFLLSGFGVRRR